MGLWVKERPFPRISNHAGGCRAKVSAHCGRQARSCLTGKPRASLFALAACSAPNSTVLE